MKTDKNLYSSIPFLTVVSVFLLAIQNLVIFWSHYFANLGFPWDFPMAYYPWVAFWTAAIEKGIFPSWVPYQSMGYPFVLQIQSGLFYPPFWIFPLLGIPHTFQAAVAFQSLHVLAGSIGMLLLLRSLVRDTRLAFLGAVIFQFFGGFYGNAQHSDIVRSFALTPWALYCFTFSVEQGTASIISGSRNTGFWPGITNWLKSFLNHPYLPLRVFFIPIVVYFFATGGYPGNLFALFFVLAIYVVAQIIQVYQRNRSFAQIFSISLVLLFLTVLGISMSTLQLGPSFVFRNEYSRLDNFQALEKHSIWMQQLPGLFLSSKTLPGEISETSAYMTLPAVIFLSFLSISTMKKHWPYALIGLVSLLMIGGRNTFFYSWVTKFIFPLALSRFPTSDYRALVVIPLIVFAILGLRDLFQSSWKTERLLVRIGFICLWFFQGLYMTYWNTPLLERLGTQDLGYLLFSWIGLHTRTTHILSAVALLLLTLGLLLFLYKKQWCLTTAAIILLAGLVSLDGMRVITDMSTWRDPSVYQEYYVDAVPQYVNNEFSAYRIFDHLPASRPERQAVDHVHWFSWRGYMEGSYQMQDYKSCPTISCIQIKDKPIFWSYMLKAWQPILLEDGWQENGPDSITVPDMVIFRTIYDLDENKNEVTQTFYGLDTIKYQVNLDQPKLMIENETYFKGWEAELRNGVTKEMITGLPVNGAFRAWKLPAGKYEMEAKFHLPYFRVMVGMSIVSFIIWLVVLILRFFLRPRIGMLPG